MMFIDDYDPSGVEYGGPLLPWMTAMVSLLGMTSCGGHLKAQEAREKNTSEIIKLQEILSSKVRRKS